MDEKKVYSVIGTVTIGTDEYRDLLTEKFEAIKEKDEYNSKWYNEYTENRRLKAEAEKMKKELDQLKKYIADNNEQDKLELWIVRTMREE